MKLISDVKETEEKPERTETDKLLEESFVEYGKAINAGDHGRAETLLMGVFQTFMMRAATAEPTPRDMWDAAKEECQQRGNWIGAIEAQKKVLELSLAETNPLISIKPRIDLASLYDMLERKEDAMVELEKAITTARAGNMETLLFMALEAKAHLELKWKCFEKAAATLQEAAAILPEEKLYDTQRARLFVLQAESAIPAADYERATTLLADAQALLRPWGTSPFFGGIQSMNGQIDAVFAQIHAAKGEWDKAVESFARTVQYIRARNEQPHLAGGMARYRLAKTLEKYAEYLDRADRHEEAEQARRESGDVMPKEQLA